MTTGSPTLQQVLAGVQLPALPQSAIRLLELSQDPENGPAEFAVPIEADPGLTGQVLRFVNSSYFGFSREIASVQLAITLVGVRTIKNFALWSAVFSLIPNPKCGGLDLKTLWQDSLRRGLFARTLGKLLNVEHAEDLFAAALLQDMAIPLLAKEFPEAYSEMLEDRVDGSLRLSDLEEKQFGWNHAQAAAQVAREWSLPDAFADLMEAHTKLDQWLAAPEGKGREVAVALSSLLPSSVDEEWHDREAFLEAFGQLDLTPDASPESLFAQVDAQFEEFAPVLRLTAPARSLQSRLVVEEAVV